MPYASEALSIRTVVVISVDIWLCVSHGWLLGPMFHPLQSSCANSFCVMCAFPSIHLTIVRSRAFLPFWWLCLSPPSPLTFHHISLSTVDSHGDILAPSSASLSAPSFLK